MRAMSLKETGILADRVDGYLGRREGKYLYSLARISGNSGVIVEIGTFKGKSTIWLANGRRAGTKGQVFAVDPHKYGTEEEFRNNIRTAGVDDIVVPIVQPSEEAVRDWSHPIAFLWIDGDHSHEAARSDFVAWEPFVCDGGIIALHDTYAWEGVRKLVDNEILTNDKFKVLGQLDSICAVRKVSRLSYADRFRRSVFIFLRAIFNRGRAKRRHWRALPRKVLRGISSPKSKD
jgi:MMP 1-O-methyltransferase